MNARKRHSTTKPVGRGGFIGLIGPIRPIGPIWLLVLALGSLARADSIAQALREGNALYADGQYTEAINKYNEALVEQPTAVEPKFNKANGYYRLDDLDEAIDLYREVATESKDMALVAKAKYNLGNCLFQQGTKQRDSDLQKAVDDMEASITSWRGVLDIDPDNVKAAENIEVARLTIKDILDQIKKQQDEQQQQNQQNQNQQDQQQQDQEQQSQGQSQQQQQEQSQEQDQQSQSQSDDSQQDQSESQQDKNHNAEQDQQQEQASGQEQQEESDQQPSEVQQQRPEAPDVRAQQILDNEQRQQEQRQMLQRRQAQPVEKDW